MKVLVVDDRVATATLLAAAFKRSGVEATARFNVRSAVAWLEEHHPDVVITDLRFDPTPDDPTPGSGLEVLAAARALARPADTIVFTAHGELDIAVTAMRHGAFDFLTKPVTFEQLWSRTLEIQRLRGIPAVNAEATVSAVPPPFVAESPKSRELVSLIEQIAPTPAPVWISGEIGSGRGHVAAEIHRRSSRPGGFHVLSPARIPRWEWPEEGTVLIPDIDCLDIRLIERLPGMLRTAPTGVRILATASSGQPSALSATSYWRDVYFSIAVLLIQVPPLRERLEDVDKLFETALDRFARQYGRDVPDNADEILRGYEGHNWPGNLRELFNVAERAVIMGTASLEQVAEPPDFRAGLTSRVPELGKGFELSRYLEDVERAILVAALHQANGDRRAAGALLGVERNALRYKLRKYGLLD